MCKNEGMKVVSQCSDFFLLVVEAFFGLSTSYLYFYLYLRKSQSGICFEILMNSAMSLCWPLYLCFVPSLWLKQLMSAFWWHFERELIFRFDLSCPHILFKILWWYFTANSHFIKILKPFLILQACWWFTDCVQMISYLIPASAWQAVSILHSCYK